MEQTPQSFPATARALIERSTRTAPTIAAQAAPHPTPSKIVEPSAFRGPAHWPPPIANKPIGNMNIAIQQSHSPDLNGLCAVCSFMVYSRFARTGESPRDSFQRSAEAILLKTRHVLRSSYD